MRERFEPLNHRYEAFLKEFEWTWTKAAVAAFALWFLAILFIGVIPSAWLYLAQSTLGWTQQKFWLFKARDVVAVILFTVPTVAFMVVPYRMQKHRQRLRGRDAPRPVGGYR
jgi:hypothetical protein